MKTIERDTEHKLIIKNSRFITLLIKIKNKEDIRFVLDSVRKKYPRANHYCYAYKIGNTIKKASDDGEPGGTAGMPMLNVLDKEDITNIIAVTVRYFGGIKLGAGGLVRAYSKSVTEAIKTVTLKELIPGFRCMITFSYEKEKDIINLVKKENIIDKKYLEKITYQVLLPKDSLLLEKDNVEILENIYIEKD